MDLIIAGGSVVTEREAVKAHVAIDNGRIAGVLELGAALPEAREVIDASGLLVMPGAVDAHTHFTGAHDSPAMEVREGTEGAAAGGVTTVIEMPHSDPPATTCSRFRWKRDLFAANSAIDFALWAGLDGINARELAGLDREGAIAFKGFLCSADPEGRAAEATALPRLDDHALLEAMRAIRLFDGLIGLHAENHSILSGARAALVAVGRQDPLAHAESAPEIAEIEAVGRAMLYAEETGVRCHIVHLSSPRAAEIIEAARSRARVSVETCVQYLMLNEEDLRRSGARARCGPPLRKQPVVDALWSHVRDGRIDALASDHCPYRPEQKEKGERVIWDAAMGLTGVQTSVPMFLAGAVKEHGMSLVKVAKMSATAPARIFGLYPRKGVIAAGADADLALYDPAYEWQIRGSEFRGAGRWSVFDGRSCGCNVVRTLVRGVTVYVDGSSRVRPGFGQWLQRNRSEDVAGKTAG